MPLNHFSVIPAERRPAVEAALLRAFNSANVTDVSLLSGGLSGSSVYKIVVNNRAYTLKLNPENTEAKSAVPLELAAAAGVAPKLYYNDRQQGVAISDFIDSKPVHSFFTPDKLVTELAATIKGIHAIPFDTKGTDLFETVDGLIHQFKKSNMISGPVFEECFLNYEMLKDVYPRTTADKVFSHNDLNPGNILCADEKLWIIDWDAAALNDRYIDLANAANFFVHTEDLESVFLCAYFGHEADDYQKACFYTMRQICRIIYSMLMFQLAVNCKPTGYKHSQEMDGVDMKAFGALMGSGKISLAVYEGQLMYAKALLNTAVAQMRTPRFADSLEKFQLMD
ncbi:phosphotransferase [Mucilaginibacter sp. SMC90]|uniref:phosphotransferase n=1 Tax=Mucilaginibacter sp. SMC90 TaxID=2929803 RepID=UPI001FB343F9|nr:phosphotransferase [Mucilaginibacter sp. SMC90]UOE46517.1 phosphotransferase [Mucilaginibacter sp. SMC90]